MFFPLFLAQKGHLVGVANRGKTFQSMKRRRNISMLYATFVKNKDTLFLCEASNLIFVVPPEQGIPSLAPFE